MNKTAPNMDGCHMYNESGQSQILKEYILDDPMEQKYKFKVKKTN